MHLAAPVSQGSVQHIGMYMQEKMGALGAPAQLPLLAHAVVDEVVHNQIRCAMLKCAGLQREPSQSLAPAADSRGHTAHSR